MWRRADRRAERPAITHRHLATRAWIKLNKKNNKRRSSNLKVQTVPEVSKSKVPRRLLIRGKLRLFVFVHKRERRRERKRGKPRTSRLSYSQCIPHCVSVSLHVSLSLSPSVCLSLSFCTTGRGRWPPTMSPDLLEVSAC